MPNMNFCKVFAFVETFKLIPTIIIMVLQNIFFLGKITIREKKSNNLEFVYFAPFSPLFAAITK